MGLHVGGGEEENDDALKSTGSLPRQRKETVGQRR